MTNDLGPLVRYFEGEKSAAVLAVALSLVSLGGAFWAYRHGEALRALMYPLAIVGLLQVALGVGLYLRTPGQVRELESSFAAQPREAARAELVRMQRVNRNFFWIEVAEGVFLLVGFGLVVAMKGRPAAAVGLGLVLESAAMLAFDAFAEQRGEQYQAWLEPRVSDTGL